MAYPLADVPIYDHNAVVRAAYPARVLRLNRVAAFYGTPTGTPQRYTNAEHYFATATLSQFTEMGGSRIIGKLSGTAQALAQLAARMQVHAIVLYNEAPDQEVDWNDDDVALLRQCVVEVNVDIPIMKDR